VVVKESEEENFAKFIGMKWGGQGGVGGGSPRNIGLGCAAHFPKPLPNL